jgi:hypothetical protein
MAAPARDSALILPQRKAEQLGGIGQATETLHRNKAGHALQFLSQRRSMVKVVIQPTFCRFNFKNNGDLGIGLGWVMGLGSC